MSGQSAENDARRATRPPMEWCGHFSSDFDGNCMRCANEARRNEELAQAWDEGWAERDNDCTEPYSPHRVNPYRVTPPASTDAEGGA